MRLSSLVACIAFAIALAIAMPCARADDAGDTLFLRNGGRLRGVVLEEDPANGTRIKLPDGTVRAFAPKDVDHVEYAASPQQVQIAPPPQPPPPVAQVVVVQPGMAAWSPEELAEIRATSPERIPYQRRRPAPPGYHYESHLRHPFWIVGASLMLTAVVADVMALTLQNGKPGENATAAAVVSIIGFGAGIPMLIYGLIPSKSYVRNDLGWFLRPTILTGHSNYGGGLAAGVSF